MTDSLTRYLNHPRRADIIERTLDVPAILRNAPERVRCPQRAARHCAEVAHYHIVRSVRLHAVGHTIAADRARRIANAADRLAQRYRKQTDTQPQRVAA
jgi:hypothetical protein